MPVCGRFGLKSQIVAQNNMVGNREEERWGETVDMLLPSDPVSIGHMGPQFLFPEGMSSPCLSL